MKSHIKIAVDAFPANTSLLHVADYSAEQVLCKTAAPLLCPPPSDASANAAALSCVYYDKRYVIQLRRGLAWTDGGAITAQHYVDALQAVAEDQRNRFRHLLSSVGQINAPTPDTIEILVENECSWIPLFLSFINASPYDVTDKARTAGPYSVVTRTTDAIVLRARDSLIEKDKEIYQELEFINYGARSDPRECIDDYLADRIQVTCDTAGHYPEMASLLKHPNCVVRDIPMGMFLTAGGRFEELSSELKQNIWRMVDRRRIVQRLETVPRAIYGFSDLYGPTRPVPNPTSDLYEPCSLTISYEDFYPNREIAEMLAAQFQSFGIRVSLVEHKFGVWAHDSHLRLDILRGPNGSAKTLYKSWISSHFLSSDIRQRAIRHYSLYLKTSDSHIVSLCERYLDSLVCESGLATPLITIPSISLVNSSIDPATLFSVGEAVRRIRTN